VHSTAAGASLVLPPLLPAPAMAALPMGNARASALGLAEQAGLVVAPASALGVGCSLCAACARMRTLTLKRSPLPVSALGSHTLLQARCWPAACVRDGQHAQRCT
jgi:hypothetical protein